jgi:hypothetical protein
MLDRADIGLLALVALVLVVFGVHNYLFILRDRRNDCRTKGIL